jgi:CubicO group peptidase (beta-lactamase class C family)
MTVEPQQHHRAGSFPPPESAGGWPRCESDAEVADTGFDVQRLDLALERQRVAVAPGDTWGVGIVRRGRLVRESYTFPALPTTSFDLWSATKSVVSAVYGVVLHASELADAEPAVLSLDSPVHCWLDARFIDTDPRKAEITVRHLLSMTSGLAGRACGLAGLQTAPGSGPYECALGFGLHATGRATGRLRTAPGERFDYSDPGFALLSPVFSAATGRTLADVSSERIFARIGIETFHWDQQGGGGHLGPMTNAHTGVHLTVRDLLRFGLLFLRGGRWDTREIIPESWVRQSTEPSTSANERYGLGWWVNRSGLMWPGLPRDAFAAVGYRSNRCYVIPSLDLVVARLGTGPTTWDEAELIGSIVDAIV